VSDSKPPLPVSAADLTALRYLAMAWGVIIMASWFVLDDLRSQLLVTGAQLVVLACTLFSVYLLRRWKQQRQKPGEDQRSRQVPR
jgi:hypothetical protein